MAKFKSKHSGNKTPTRATSKTGKNPGKGGTLRRPALGPNTEWVAAVVPLGVNVTPPGEAAYHPEAIVWLIPNGPILGATLGRKEEIQDLLLDSFRETCAEPMSGPAHVPARVRVESTELAASLRDVLDAPTQVVCAPTPEIAEVAQALDTFFRARGSEEKQSYLGPDVTPPAVAGFFDAAARLYRSAPWKVLENDTDILSMTIEELELYDVVVCVIGQAGQSLGVVFFADRDDFEEFLDAVEAYEKGEELSMPPHMAINFDRGAEMTTDLRKEISHHGWKVAAPDAYPWLVVVDEDVLGRPPSANELLSAECAALALAELVQTTPNLRQAWRSQTPIERKIRVKTHDGPIEVVFTAPYPTDEEAFDEQEAVTLVLRNPNKGGKFEAPQPKKATLPPQKPAAPQKKLASAPPPAAANKKAPPPKPKAPPPKANAPAPKPKVAAQKSKTAAQKTRAAAAKAGKAATPASQHRTKNTNQKGGKAGKPGKPAAKPAPKATAQRGKTR